MPQDGMSAVQTAPQQDECTSTEMQSHTLANATGWHWVSYLLAA